jgi:hypothetical protein
MYLFFKKKQNLKNTNYITKHYQNIFVTKKKIIDNLNKDADISFPIFSKNVNSFTLHGLKTRKKMKKNHINQTITIQTKLNKQLIYLTVNTQCPIVKIR